MTTPYPVSQLVVFLYASDTARSWHFYGELLGLELTLDQGACRIYRVGGKEGFLGVCQARAEQKPPPPDRAPRGVVLTLVTPDVDGLYATLKARGVPFDTAPAFSERFNVYSCFFRDPDGYLLELQEFPPPAWPKPRPA